MNDVKKIEKNKILIEIFSTSSDTFCFMGAISAKCFSDKLGPRGSARPRVDSTV